MKVSVLRLRRAGEKLARDQLGEPSIGWLRIERWRLSNRYEDRWVRTAALFAGPGRGASRLIPAINDVEITSMDESGFLLAGFEEAERLQDQGPRQTWWCRPVTDPPTETRP